MKVIYKYKLVPRTPVKMAAGAKVLTAASQRNDICIWAEADDSVGEELRYFEIIPTGGVIEDEVQLKYINTVFVRELVFHIYENL